MLPWVQPGPGGCRTPLAGFLVRVVCAAPFAELVQLDTLAGVGFALCCDVVTSFALLASERDRRSLVGGHCRFLSMWRLPRDHPGQRHVYLLSAVPLPERGCYLMIFVTRPAPTVRPPSRIANRKPSSIAIGLINSTVISVLSPGITISVPSGKDTDPVTSVVRK